MRWYPWWTSAQKSTFPPRDENVLFHRSAPTGWGRRRDLGDYLKGRSEHDFRDQHDRFTEEQA